MLALIIIIFFAILYVGSQEKEREAAADDELAKFRNMTAAEILDELDPKDKGKRVNPLREFEMEAGSYYFEPNIIEAKLYDKVRLNITTVDINHTIKIPSFFVQRDIIVGEQAMPEFIASKEGTYMFFSNENENMTGKIIITQ